jgi:hypothetical protein
MLKRKFFYAVFLFFMPGFIPVSYAQQGGNIAQEDMAQLKQLEDSLIVMADSMLGAPLPDDRIDYCIRFVKFLKTAMEIPGSYQYPFASLGTKIHIIVPDDKSFRIFNWMVAPADNLRRYYGAIQMPGEDAQFYPLKDFSEKLGEDAQTVSLSSDQWYGCEYYRIMTQTIQGGQKAYLLFGFNSNGAASNRKLLDVLTFSQGKPVFGAPVFMMPDVKTQRLTPQSRVVLEYKKTAQVSLNYDEAKKMIMFNRLMSDINDPNRKNTYAPTGQTDGLRYENGMYIFIRDAIPVLKLQDGQAPIDGVMTGG